MPQVSTPNLTRVLRIRNTTDTARELWLEPLGDRVVLDPNGLYELTATDALEEIDFSADGFAVYGWIVRVVAIAADGTRQIVWEIPSDPS